MHLKEALLRKKAVSPKKVVQALGTNAPKPAKPKGLASLVGGKRPQALNIFDTYADVYGGAKNLNKELDAVSDYVKRTGMPVDMSKSIRTKRDIPLMDLDNADGGHYMPRQSRKALDEQIAIMEKEQAPERLMELAKQMRGQIEEGAEFSTEYINLPSKPMKMPPGTDMNRMHEISQLTMEEMLKKDKKGVALHEMAHAATDDVLATPKRYEELGKYMQSLGFDPRPISSTDIEVGREDLRRMLEWAKQQKRSIAEWEQATQAARARRAKGARDYLRVAPKKKRAAAIEEMRQALGRVENDWGDIGGSSIDNLFRADPKASLYRMAEYMALNPKHTANALKDVSPETADIMRATRESFRARDHFGMQLAADSDKYGPLVKRVRDKLALQGLAREKESLQSSLKSIREQWAENHKYRHGGKRDVWTYPESSEAEVFPAISAMQRQAYADFGRTLRTPQEYEEYVMRFMRLSDDEFEAAMSTKPIEFRRAMRYHRVVLLKDPAYAKRFMKTMSTMAPGIRNVALTAGGLGGGGMVAAGMQKEGGLLKQALHRLQWLPYLEEA